MKDYMEISQCIDIQKYVPFKSTKSISDFEGKYMFIVKAKPYKNMKYQKMGYTITVEEDGKFYDINTTSNLIVKELDDLVLRYGCNQEFETPIRCTVVKVETNGKKFYKLV